MTVLPYDTSDNQTNFDNRKKYTTNQESCRFEATKQMNEWREKKTQQNQQNIEENETIAIVLFALTGHLFLEMVRFLF